MGGAHGRSVTLTRLTRGDRDWYRLTALLGLALVLLPAVQTLHGITVILGGSVQLLLRLAIVLALAWTAARFLSRRSAIAIFGLLAVASYLWYFLSVTPDATTLLTAPWPVMVNTINDSIRVITGTSVLAIYATDVWALSFAPAPVFLAWYFGFRRRYALAALVAGATTAVFVLSGDLDWWWTLLATVGAVTVVGVGSIERRGASREYVEWLVVLMTLMIVVSVTAPVIPASGQMSSLSLVGDDDSVGESGRSLQSTVVGADEELTIIGEIELDPEVRYTIESPPGTYWRTGVYDRYTGDGWVRTGSVSTFEEPNGIAPGRRLVEQEVRVEVETTRLPAASRPVSIDGLDTVVVNDHGAIRTQSPLAPGERFTVTSAVPNVSNLSGSVSYDQEVLDRYTQLPEDVPDRVHQLTDDLLVGTEDPLEKATRIESFLEAEKEYSLNVTRPQGDIADAFLFDMDAGYCTYFATTMVTMLRSADVPARLAVGYANGQQVDANRWVVRGLNSHAWVEVYHPEAGWVTFDPTPSSARSTARSDRVDAAREEGLDTVDTEESTDLPYDQNPVGDEGRIPGNDTIGNDTVAEGPSGLPQAGLERIQEFNDSVVDLEQFRNETNGTAPPTETDRHPVAWERIFLLILVSVGVVTGAYRLQPWQRVRRELAFRWQRPTDDPRTDIDRARRRFERALSRRFRPRRPAETRREYHRLYRITHEDRRVDRLFELIERARYGGHVNRPTATEAIGLADRVVAETVVLGGGWLPNPKPVLTWVGDRIL